MATSNQPFNGLGPKVKQAYTKAIASGACLYTESEVIELDDEATGIPFELRYAPQLAKKPTPNKPSNDGRDEQSKQDDQKRDPFAEPYPEPDLYVHEEELKEDASDQNGDTFVILLNKYCLMPRHFLLVTKEFERQERPLTPLQLLATYSILKSLGTREKHLAFFNCGEDSGASQPHKHVQFIPLSNGVAPFDNFIQQNKPENTKDPFQLPLPYASFTSIIAPPQNGDLLSYLGMTFLTLLDLMIDHLRRLSLSTSTTEATDSQTRPTDVRKLSYNLIMTTSYLQLIPRSNENYLTEQGNEVSINSLGFAGMCLVKEESVLEEIKKVGVLKVLEKVGFEPVVRGELGEEVVEE